MAEPVPDGPRRFHLLYERLEGILIPLIPLASVSLGVTDAEVFEEFVVNGEYGVAVEWAGEALLDREPDASATKLAVGLVEAGTLMDLAPELLARLRERATSEMRTVRLSPTQLTYLVGAPYLPSGLRDHFEGVSAADEVAVSLDIDGRSAEEIRTRLTERLAEVGFDEAYEPTDEGRLLEDLLDALMG